MNWESARAVVEKVNTHDNVTIVCATKTVPSEIMNDICDSLVLSGLVSEEYADYMANYEELEKFTNNWRRNMFKQNEIVKRHIKDFFKYIRMEGTYYHMKLSNLEKTLKRNMLQRKHS